MERRSFRSVGCGVEDPAVGGERLGNVIRRSHRRGIKDENLFVYLCFVDVLGLLHY
jgi:hypothetical protein